MPVRYVRLAGARQFSIGLRSAKIRAVLRPCSASVTDLDYPWHDWTAIVIRPRYVRAAGV